MIRQAHTYLVSAMSGATLIAIAIVVFVLLVSAQVFRDWPIAALGGSDGPHISESRAVAHPAATGTTTADGGGTAKAVSTGSKRPAKGGDQAKPSVGSGDLATSDGSTAPAETPTGSENGGPGGGGNQAGSGAPGSSPSGSAPSSSSQGSSSSSSPSGGNSGSGSAASAPAAKVTETVNNTVNQVDETVTGGSLGKTGVTGVTEGVVNGVAGPESAVGKVVDETVGAVGKTVGGLLGGNP